jgi:hypothetical protein
MLTIATTCYNVIKMNFDWESTLQNWIDFLENSGEIVIVVNKSEDDSLGAITRFIDQVKVNSVVKFKIINENISYDDPEFDGKLKNIAYKKSTQPYIIQLDMDEVLPLSSKNNWIKFAL